LPSTLLLGQLKEGHLQSWRITDPVVTPRLYSATSMQRPQTMASKIVLKTISELFAQRRRAAGRLHDEK
jgi:LysR family transcriptional regulator, nitrogen assimilation regulatory protein